MQALRHAGSRKRCPKQQRVHGQVARRSAAQAAAAAAAARPEAPTAGPLALVGSEFGKLPMVSHRRSPGVEPAALQGHAVRPEPAQPEASAGQEEVRPESGDR